MRRFPDLLARLADSAALDMQELVLPARRLQYTLAGWRQRSVGSSDGDFSTRRPSGWPCRCRHAPFSALTSRWPRRPSRSRRLRPPSPKSVRRPRPDRLASPVPRPSSNRRISNRQTSNRRTSGRQMRLRPPRASPSIRSGSSASASATRRIGLARPANAAMRRRRRSGVISARIARLTYISISTSRRG